MTEKTIDDLVSARIDLLENRTYEDWKHIYLTNIWGDLEQGDSNGN